MKRILLTFPRFAVIGLVIGAMGAMLLASRARGADDGGSVFSVINESGEARTINVGGFPVVALRNPFFLSLGVNGRKCVTCHQPENNMTVTPSGLRLRFAMTRGRDPIFRPNDGSNSPLADVSTETARYAAYSMLLSKGVIRIGLPIPANAEFDLVAVKDPYNFASSRELSLFRRPLPSTNLAFISTVMWDGRETIEKGSSAAIHFDFDNQSNDATQGHAQRPDPIDQATREQIVAYELGLYTAQVFDIAAGRLEADGATGGPGNLSRQLFRFGGNDPLGCDPTGAVCDPSNAQFSPIVFTEYDAWRALRGHGRNGARAAVARGQDLFNTLQIPIAGVAGINDDFSSVFQQDFNTPILGTCTTCHDTPHAGDHSVPAPLNIGVADPPVLVTAGGDGAHNQFGLAVGDMPVYTLRHKTTGEMKIVTDPGRALITGKWKDVGRFKGPILRGLAGRGPYFHNGSATTLLDVVNFYDKRFKLNLTDDDKAVLVAFLRTL